MGIDQRSIINIHNPEALIAIDLIDGIPTDYNGLQNCSHQTEMEVHRAVIIKRSIYA